MNDSKDLKDIFEAMEEINNLSEKRRENKETLILDKSLEITTKSSLSKEKNIPIETEELIKQAEKKNSSHIENIILLFDTPDVFTIDVSLNKTFSNNT